MRFLKAKSDLHLTRKLFHLVAVGSILIIYHNVTRAEGLRYLSWSIAIAVLLEIARQHIPSLQKFVYQTIGPLMRKTELKRFTSATYLLFGVYFIVYFFPSPIVHLSLLFLAFGDPIASTFGILYGKDRLIGKKSLQGTMACFITCTVLSYIFYWQAGIMTERLFLASALSGLIGALAELVPVGKIDDNLSIPVISSVLLLGLFHLFGSI